MAVCCYILACPKSNKAAVIDPGGDEGKILITLSEMGCSLEKIIATHGHPDHVCGIRRLQEASGAKIVMHREDAAFFGKPEVGQYFAMLGMEACPPVDIEVEDGDEITIGEERLQVIHTPGHTPGGICLYQAPNLFTGDSLFVGGIGRTDFPGGSYQQLVDSIREKLFILPAETLVWPGHGYGGSCSTIGVERSDNPYL